MAHSFDYEAHGYQALKASSMDGVPERIVLADVYNGKVGAIRQAVLDGSETLHIERMQSDLWPYSTHWKMMFKKLSEIITPLMGHEYEIRIQRLYFDVPSFHNDPNVIIGIQPLGVGRKATVCEAPDGSHIYSEDESFVITTPALRHSSPVSDFKLDPPRAAIMATKYAHQIR